MVRYAITMGMILASAGVGRAGATLPPVELQRRIPLPGVAGRLDHLAVDFRGRRLFVAALENNTVEVVDLTRDRRVTQIAGLREPQGILFLPRSNEIVVSNGGDGTLRVYDGRMLKLKQTVDFKEDADNVRPEPTGNRIFVGFDRGLGVVDTRDWRRIAGIPLDGHPEAFALERKGPRIFVNVPVAREVAVVDRASKRVTARWHLARPGGNFPLALDEQHHHLFLGCRKPPRLVVMDTRAGKTLAQIPSSGDVDDLFFDPEAQRLYASCGEGFIDIFEQVDPDHYRMAGKVPTAPGARTSLLVPEERTLFVAVPRRGSQEAEVRIYRIPVSQGTSSAGVLPTTAPSASTSSGP